MFIYYLFFLFFFFFFFFNDTATTEIYTLSLHDAHRSPPINLRHDLVYGAREARAVVGEFSADPVCPDPGALDAWRDAVRRYPRLRLVPPSFIAGWGRRRLNSIRQCLVERSEGRICR